MSSHCAASLHVDVGCAVGPMRHAEFFADHERIEQELFEGTPNVENGALKPNCEKPGHGLEFKWQDAERYAA